MKWLWRYSNEEDVLWRRVVKINHGAEGYWHTIITAAPHGVGPQKHISKLGNEFSGKVKIHVDDGENILF